MSELYIDDIIDYRLKEAMRVVERYITKANCEDCELKGLCEETKDNSLCELIH